MVAGVRQSFNFSDKVPGFYKTIELSLFFYGIFHYLISITKL